MATHTQRDLHGNIFREKFDKNYQKKKRTSHDKITTLYISIDTDIST